MLARYVLFREAVRWLARGLSVFSAILLLLFVVGEPFPVAKLTAAEWLGLLFFPVGVTVGFAVAWWREGLGGLITTASLIAFYLVFVFVMNEGLKDGVWFVVFASPAFLFLLSWLLGRSYESKTLKAAN
jgi:hypothetical protein